MEKSGKKSGIVSFVTNHPYFSVIVSVCSLIGILGIPLSIYFFYQSKEKGFLTYCISTIKPTISMGATDKDPEFKILYNEIEVKQDITMAQITIWNQGKKRINNDDIRDKITLYTEKAPIIYASVKTNHENVKFILNINSFDKRKLDISWNKFLAHKDMGKIQIFYLGSSNEKINISGSLVGQNEIKRFEYPQHISFKLKTIIGILFTFICCFVMWVTSAILCYLLGTVNTSKARRVWKLFIVLLACMGTFFFGNGIYKIIVDYPLLPPMQ